MFVGPGKTYLLTKKSPCLPFPDVSFPFGDSPTYIQHVSDPSSSTSLQTDGPVSELICFCHYLLAAAYSSDKANTASTWAVVQILILEINFTRISGMLQINFYPVTDW